MANTDRMAVLPGQLDQFVQLPANLFFIFHIVEEHIASGGFDEIFPRHLLRHCLVGCAAVNKEQAAFPDAAHQPPHRGGIPGQ